MAPGAQAAVVVFDANVLISACCAIRAGAPFPGPLPRQPSTLDEASLGCCSLVATVADEIHLTLYGDSALDQLVLRKLTQPADPAVIDERRGLGWTEQEAIAIYQRIADGVDHRYEELQPSAASEIVHGLDYEDGRIYGLFLAAKGDRAWSEPILVTNDRSFAQVVNDQAHELHSGLPEWRAVSARQFLRIYESLLQ